MSGSPDTLEQRWARLRPHVRVHGPGGGKRPTVIQFHGCGGLGAHQVEYANAAAELGVRTVIVDSFAPRGWPDAFGKAFVCTGMVFRGAERAGDVLAAAYGAIADLDADPDALVLAGWSHGGWAIMDLMTMPLASQGEAGLADPTPEPLAGVKGLFLAYPYGGLTALSRDRDWVRRPRSLALLGELDMVTTAKDAGRIYERIIAGGCELEVWRARGRHAFDEPGTEMSWLRYDRSLATAAVQRYQAFLRAVLPPLTVNPPEANLLTD